MGSVKVGMLSTPDSMTCLWNLADFKIEGPMVGKYPLRFFESRPSSPWRHLPHDGWPKAEILEYCG